MSAKKFVQLLEDNGALDASTLREVRRQISDKKVSAATIARALVEKGKLTKFQATKFVGEATADSAATDDDESGLLLVEDAPPAEEVVMLEDAEADVPEEVVGLTPVHDAGAALTPVGGAQSSGSGGLEALDGGLEPLGGGGLESLDPFDTTGSGLDTLDPFAQPTKPPPADDEESGSKRGRGKKNQQDWGGKLMIGGGGLLLFLILAGGLLYYNITKQNPIELFEKAEEAYRSESYPAAMEAFVRFVDRFPRDDNADDAQVRIALCRIRIVIGDPQRAYDTAKEQLPPVQSLAAFSTARDELATLLPAIPRGFIKKARAAADTSGMEEMIVKAEQALADLVNKPEYIPTGKRPKEILDRIDEDIKIVRRAISQDRDLAKAIGEIKQHAAADKTVEAYQVYKALLGVYPGVVDNEGLQAAVLEITDKLKNLVKSEEATIESLKTEESLKSEFRVILASTSTGAAKGVPRLNGQIVPLLAAGSVYGVDAGTGHGLWRRYVGHETKHHPQPLSVQPDADILIADARLQELVRVKSSGELVWRLPIGESFQSPSIAGDQIYVATQSGKIVQVDAATGNSTRRVALPQNLDVSPGVAQIHPYLIQVGDHSNLYAIATDSLACREVVYTGHKAGAIVTPPLIVQDHVLIAENAGRDYCLLHVFKITPSGDGPLLQRPLKAPIRLTGNVIVPMVLYGRRPLVVTDLGEVNVFNIDFNSEKDTITTATAPLPASRSAPLLSYPVVEGTTLVLADDKLVKYQLQVTTKQITQKSVTNVSDPCIAPPRLFGDILIVMQRKAGSAGATVSALQVDNFRQPEWETQLGTPVSWVAPAGSQLDVVTAAAALFEVDGNVLKAGASNEPAMNVGTTAGARSFTDPVAFPTGKVALFNPVNNERALIYTPGGGPGRLRIVQLKLSGAKVTSIPVAFQDGLLTPLSNGSVMLANTTTGDNLVLPFQPELGPGEDVKWQRPAVFDDAFVVVDDRKGIYRVGIKAEPKPFLAPLASGKLEVDIDSDLAAAGDTIYGVVRNSGGDVIVALSATELKSVKEFALTGRIVWGPAPVGNAVLCLSSAEGLLCFEDGGKQRWANSAGCGGQPAGVPLEVDGDFVFALREGSVVRIAGTSGEQVALANIGEPLGSGPVAFGKRLLLPGSDGALHVIPTPVPTPGAPTAVTPTAEAPAPSTPTPSDEAQ